MEIEHNNVFWAGSSRKDRDALKLFLSQCTSLSVSVRMVDAVYEVCRIIYYSNCT